MEYIIEGIPKPTINWISNGKEFTAKDGVQIAKDVDTDTYTLTIPKLNPTSHAGSIIVKATNVVGSVQHEIDINIQGFYLFYTLLDVKFLWNS